MATDETTQTETDSAGDWDTPAHPGYLEYLRDRTPAGRAPGEAAWDADFAPGMACTVEHVPGKTLAGAAQWASHAFGVRCELLVAPGERMSGFALVRWSGPVDAVHAVKERLYKPSL